MPELMTVALSKGCVICEAPARAVWPPSTKRPTLQVHLTRGWLTLLHCPDCLSKWMAIPYEPYASFIYLSRWTRSSDDWLAINALDDGVTLCRWGDAQVRAAWAGMNDEDKAAVETHRKRSYGRNPIDDTTAQAEPDIDRLLAEARA